MTLGKLKDVASTHASAIISVGIFFLNKLIYKKFILAILNLKPSFYCHNIQNLSHIYGYVNLLP